MNIFSSHPRPPPMLFLSPFFTLPALKSYYPKFSVFPCSVAFWHLFHSDVSILPSGSPQPPHTEPNSSSGLKPPACSLKFLLRLTDNLLALAFAAGAATSSQEIIIKSCSWTESGVLVPAARTPRAWRWQPLEGHLAPSHFGVWGWGDARGMP